MIELKQGDCLELMKDIPDRSVDMVLCDLPYGMTACKWDTVISFEKLWEQYNRITKDRSAVVLFGSQPFTTRLIGSNMKHYRYNWYWKKNNVTGFSYARYQPMRCIEEICVFYKQHPKYHPQGVTERENPIKKSGNAGNVYGERGTLNHEHYSKFTGYPKHILEFNNEAASNRNRFHPTQKPVALLEYLIKTYTDKGDTVLDNCMGSGSTGVACVRTGRGFIGMELDENYYSIARERIAEARKGQP